MTEIDRLKRIEHIRDLPKALRASIDGLSDNQLDTPYRDGGWTVRQVVHHVADSHMNAFIRMKLTLTEDHPTVKPYDQDAWAAMYDGRSLPPESSMAIITALHARWYEMLTRVTDAEWSRRAFHPDNGEMTLQDFLVTYSDHGRNHVKQITDLRDRNRW